MGDGGSGSSRRARPSCDASAGDAPAGERRRSRGGLLMGRESFCLAVAMVALLMVDCLAARRLLGPLLTPGWILTAAATLSFIVVVPIVLSVSRESAARMIVWSVSSCLALGLVISSAGSRASVAFGYALIAVANVAAAVFASGAAADLLSNEAVLPCGRALPCKPKPQGGRVRWAGPLLGCAVGVLLGLVAADRAEESQEALWAARAFVAVLLSAASAAALVPTSSGAARGAAEEGREGVQADFRARVAELGGEFGLTRREGDVLVLLVRGYSLPVIGERLSISLGTVDTHVKHIYKKMGIHSRKELLDIFNTLPNC